MRLCILRSTRQGASQGRAKNCYAFNHHVQAQIHKTMTYIKFEDVHAARTCVCTIVLPHTHVSKQISCEHKDQGMPRQTLSFMHVMRSPSVLIRDMPSLF